LINFKFNWILDLSVYLALGESLEMDIAFKV
jgi:hypothetical protein